ncbi:MAG: hypothetical protein EA381_16930 [Planctomycetaceae bacterium]|nr:MAG: hypothetical protein EA381_16930 [Planctomycetaceae bacterium]
MIIIYNPMGALVGLFGLIIGVALFVVTQSLAVGFLAIAGIWCWFGRSKLNLETGKKRAAPSFFFIPLFYWGILVAIAAYPARLVDNAGGLNQGQPVADDPRADQFKLDEAGLRTNQSDAPELSAALGMLISETLPSEPFNLSVKSSDDAVLVLIKLPGLKELSERNRRALLEGVRNAAQQQRPDVQVFVGIKGKLLYGAILTPDQPMQVGKIVSKDALYAFYRSEETPDEAAVDAGLNESPQSSPPTQPDFTDSVMPSE